MDFEEMTAQRIKDTGYLVEVDSFGQYCLWTQWASDSPDRQRSWPALPWEQLNPGCLRTIGHVNDHPVCVCMSWAKVGSLLVCFIDATSRMVDWGMIDEWRAATFPNVRKTDAMNFHMCAQACEESKAG